jgi:hypothetical protein
VRDPVRGLHLSWHRVRGFGTPLALEEGRVGLSGCGEANTHEPETELGMLVRLLGKDATPQGLKGELDRTTAEMRGVAHRVANASTPGFEPFGDVLARVEEGEVAPSLEDEMISLADNQLRFEATARMLQQVYRQIRSSVGGG